jgi:subtilase family serine protease
LISLHARLRAGLAGATAGACVLAAGAGVAAARPYHIAVSARYAQPPTTRQCVQQIGIPCYRPAQFQKAYDMNALYAGGLNGAGKTIVLVDSFGSPTMESDLHTFDQAFGLPDPKLTIIQPDGPVPAWSPTGAQPSWGFESSLDVEYAHAMAPGANILLVETPVAETEGIVGIPQMVQAENYVIDHHLGDVISQSWGATEQTFPSPGSILEQRSAYKNAAAHHVTVLASAGDTGATNYMFNGADYYPFPVVGWPASDPLVTAVGGTQLHLDEHGNRTAPDNVWNDEELGLFNSPAAGSGGLSSVFSRPDYQNSVAGVVGSHRGIPDVALSAAVDGAALIYISYPWADHPAGWYVVGGTSEASPLLAGFVAVADQAAGHDLGLLNPALYRLGSGAPGLPDITIGNNTVSYTLRTGKTVTVQGYNAVPGYDLASGLGTIDGRELAGELAR